MIEAGEDINYYFAVFLMKKKDHQEMLRKFKNKEICDIKHSINLGIPLKNISFFLNKFNLKIF